MLFYAIGYTMLYYDMLCYVMICYVISYMLRYVILFFLSFYFLKKTTGTMQIHLTISDAEYKDIICIY